MKVKKLWWISLAGAVLLTGLCFIVSMNLKSFQAVLLPDKGPDWYYWKLPAVEVWAAVTAWGLYLAHQITVWVLIFKLRRAPLPAPGEAGKYNFALLWANLGFILLHMLQTLLFYDGLAQYVPVMSSQGSVILMLVLILILLNDRRGLFFGKKTPLSGDAVKGVSSTHGIIISWALVYTFWFHPIEGTAGHLIGFFYMFLLMIQMSLAKTGMHFNMRWITALEVLVGFHGAIVAIISGNGMWQMFFFGFMMMFIVTQMYGLKLAKWLRIALTTLYFAGTVAVYSGIFGNNQKLYNIHQITWIPLILYALVFAVVWIYQLALFTGKRLKRKKGEKPRI